MNSDCFAQSVYPKRLSWQSTRTKRRRSTTRTHPGDRKGDKSESGRRELVKKSFDKTKTDEKQIRGINQGNKISRPSQSTQRKELASKFLDKVEADGKIKVETNQRAQTGQPWLSTRRWKPTETSRQNLRRVFSHSHPPTTALKARWDMTAYRCL